MRKAMVIVAMVATLVINTTAPAMAGDLDGSGPVHDINPREHVNRAPSPTYVVREGDTLSERFPMRWPYVCIVNVATGVIQDCDSIRPGQRLDRLVTRAEMAAIDSFMAALPEPEPVVVEVYEPPAQASEPQPAPAPATSYGSGSGCDYAIPCEIVMCESGGNYDAENPTSTASGAYQIIDGTWDGYGGYSHASDAPPHIQDERAAQIYAGGSGRGNWVC